MQTMDLQEILNKNPHLDPAELERVRKALEDSDCGRASYRLATQPRRIRIGGEGAEDARTVRLRSQR